MKHHKITPSGWQDKVSKNLEFEVQDNPYRMRLQRRLYAIFYPVFLHSGFRVGQNWHITVFIINHQHAKENVETKNQDLNRDIFRVLVVFTVSSFMGNPVCTYLFKKITFLLVCWSCLISVHSHYDCVVKSWKQINENKSKNQISRDEGKSAKTLIICC